MNNVIILDVKCGVTEGGIACGPVDGNVVATVKFSDNGNIKYLTEVEVGGIPNFYLTEEDKFEQFLAEDFDDEDWCNYMDEHFIDEFEGIELGCDYDEFEEINESNDEYSRLVRYIITVIRSDYEEMDTFIETTKGTNVKDIIFPEIDIFEDMEDSEDEENNEIYALLTEVDGYINIEPLCMVFEEAESYCDKKWESYSQSEKNELARYEIVKTRIYFSEVIGAVFDDKQETLKNYICED